MALVSISEAARLVRKSAAVLDQDIQSGSLSKTITDDGEATVDTSELLRVYGRLYGNNGQTSGASVDDVKIALLEERARSLERVLALEAELRKVKDQVANELRARLADKENAIKILENKLLFLEYDRQVDAVPTLETLDRPPKEHKRANAARDYRPAWWTRIFKRK